jgi:hypothetical protein
MNSDKTSHYIGSLNWRALSKFYIKYVHDLLNDIVTILGKKKRRYI